ncbi:MAG: M20 aminoacylase family protein [Pseudomonadota bacterium]
MPIKNRIADMAPEIAGWRRELHANPELRFEEHRTSAFVAKKLTEFGCDEVVTGVGQTGVVGVIKGRLDGDRVIGFRADMDALPILESTGVEYASQTPGKMHACGHDGHTSMLLGAAKYLAETRNFLGSVILIFQPAEEGGGGARAMLKDGLIDRWSIQEVYGMHNWPGLPAGAFAVRDGAQMGAVDFFTITVKGRGGHAALPHLTVDTSVAASAIVLAAQSIAARNLDPLKTMVLSIGGIRSDTDTFNVIPDTVTLKGTVRYLEPEVQDLVIDRLTSIAETTAAAYGATAEIAYTKQVSATINDPGAAERAAQVARSVAGDVIRDMDPVMPGEDFSDMLRERPGAYLFIGNGDSQDLHHPAYDFNDDIIATGSSWFAEMAETGGR